MAQPKPAAVHPHKILPKLPLISFNFSHSRGQCQKIGGNAASEVEW